MSLLRHALFASTYGMLAVAAALLLPRFAADVGKDVAAVIGAAVLVFGAVVHEVHSRHQRERQLKSEIGALAASRDAVMDELSRAREEVRAIHTQLLERPRADEALEAVHGELRLLHDLVDRLSAGRPPPGQAARRHDRRPAAHGLAPAGGVAPGATGDRGEDAILALVRDAVRQDRIAVARQPIVSLPQRKVRHYEAFARVCTPEGAVLEPEHFRPLAERGGLSAAIDNLLLFRCIQTVRNAIPRQAARTHFVSISRGSLHDAAFMGELVEFLRTAPELAPYLVFQFDFADVREALAGPPQPLRDLAELGFRLSIDEARDLDVLDVDTLARAQVRFLKVDGRRLLGERDDPDRPLDVARLRSALDQRAIDLVADGIDSERLLVELLDVPIDFGQGPLFGDPVGA